MTSLNFYYLHKGPVSKDSHMVGLGLQHMNLVGGHNLVHSKNHPEVMSWSGLRMMAG